MRIPTHVSKLVQTRSPATPPHPMNMQAIHSLIRPHCFCKVATFILFPEKCKEPRRVWLYTREAGLYTWEAWLYTRQPRLWSYILEERGYMQEMQDAESTIWTVHAFCLDYCLVNFQYIFFGRLSNWCGGFKDYLRLPLWKIVIIWHSIWFCS